MTSSLITTALSASVSTAVAAVLKSPKLVAISAGVMVAGGCGYALATWIRNKNRAQSQTRKTPKQRASLKSNAVKASSLKKKTSKPNTHKPVGRKSMVISAN